VPVAKDGILTWNGWLLGAGADGTALTLFEKGWVEALCRGKGTEASVSGSTEYIVYTSCPRRLYKADVLSCTPPLRPLKDPVVGTRHLKPKKAIYEYSVPVVWLFS
jgi:hypothetical protein